MQFRILLAAIALLLAAPCASSPAQPTALSSDQAAQKVRATGGSVRACQRRALHHFHCWARYWFEVFAEEELPSGEWVQCPPEYFSVEWPVDVGLKGAKVHER